MNKIIFDTSITGHHCEYISHLIDFLSVHDTGELNYIFVVHTEFEKNFPTIYNKGKEIRCVTWVQVTAEELIKIQKGNSLVTSFRTINVMETYAKRYTANHIVALDFHTIKYGAIFKKLPCSLSSILFLQFYRLSTRTFKEKIEFYKRYWITKLCVRNPKISKIYVLNDQETVDYMNNEFKKHCFEMLPDPIPHFEPLPEFDIYKHYKINQNRKIYLHIGSLGDRKGTLEVIEAAQLIPPSMQDKISILLVGKTGITYETLYNTKIKELDGETKVQLIWDNQFVSYNMMKSLFDQCDFVLLPYKNAEFSSGILGHAAASNKMVIATNAGLLKELVLKYNLGKLLDTNDAFNIALKMVEVFDQKVFTEGQQSFVKKHDPMVFASLLLRH